MPLPGNPGMLYRAPRSRVPDIQMLARCRVSLRSSSPPFQSPSIPAPYPPSDVPDDASLFSWELAVDDIAAVMRGLRIERAHLVGLSMGGYAALQFGLRYPEKASAIVAASVGSGSHPSQRDKLIPLAEKVDHALARCSRLRRGQCADGQYRRRDSAHARIYRAKNRSFCVLGGAVNEWLKKLMAKSRDYAGGRHS
jgi:pimeloyl-ACP methyl ester carboxylesterase